MLMLLLQMITQTELDDSSVMIFAEKNRSGEEIIKEVHCDCRVRGARAFSVL